MNNSVTDLRQNDINQVTGFGVCLCTTVTDYILSSSSLMQSEDDCDKWCGGDGYVLGVAKSGFASTGAMAIKVLHECVALNKVTKKDNNALYLYGKKSVLVLRGNSEAQQLFW